MVLDCFAWVPDKQMIQAQYRLKTGRNLNLNQPSRYTEKLQWYKLYYRDPLMKLCSDKYGVRDYINNKGLGHILNELYAVYESPQAIDLAKLPSRFVLKSTNGASGIGLYICHDKDTLDIFRARNITRPWMKIKKKSAGREWVYEDTPPKIIAEALLPSQYGNSSVVDYKFFCFEGKPYCMYVMVDRFSKRGVQQSILDMDYRVMPFMREKISPVGNLPPRPSNFEEMINIAKLLSADFPFVRVDLYNVDGKIIFGELTFFPESGYYQFEPDAFDFYLGNLFKLPEMRIFDKTSL